MPEPAEKLKVFLDENAKDIEVAVGIGRVFRSIDLDGPTLHDLMLDRPEFTEDA